MPSGEKRGFIEDGDEIIFRGFCARPGLPRIGFGECRAVILPAGQGQLMTPSSEVPARSAGLEGCSRGFWAVALRGSALSTEHLRVTENITPPAPTSAGAFR